jgi:DNA-binding transcriptional MerR regulator
VWVAIAAHLRYNVIIKGKAEGFNMKKLQENMQKQHELALDKFMEQIGEIREKIAQLQEHADEHLGFAPDDINWGHVGTAGSLLEKLTELTENSF